jgi:hypothetical protein
MRTKRAKIILVALSIVIVLFGVIAFIALTPTGPPVSLTILGYKTNRFSDVILRTPPESGDLIAVVALTNNCRRTLNYWTSSYTKKVSYDVLIPGAQGWKPSGSGLCGGMMDDTIVAPSQGFTFEAAICASRSAPCKVAVSYREANPRCRILRHLPLWMAKRLPVERFYGYAMTEEIYPQHDEASVQSQAF